jgi:hypothetical protein
MSCTLKFHEVEYFIWLRLINIRTLCENKCTYPRLELTQNCRWIGRLAYKLRWASHKTQDEDKTNEKNKTKKQSKPNHNTDIKINDDCRNHTIKVTWELLDVLIGFN